MLDLLATYFGSGNSLTFILWPVFIGILLGLLYTILQGLVLGRFMRKLTAEQILSPAQAKTLAELGFEKNPLLNFALRRGATLRRIVLLQPANQEADADLLLLSDTEANTDYVDKDKAAFTDDTDAETDDACDEEADTNTRIQDPALVAVEKNRSLKPDFSSDKWYLNPAERAHADLYSRRGASPLVIVFSIVALFGLAMAGFYLIPFITDLFGSIF